MAGPDENRQLNSSVNELCSLRTDACRDGETGQGVADGRQRDRPAQLRPARRLRDGPVRPAHRQLFLRRRVRFRIGRHSRPLPRRRQLHKSVSHSTTPPPTSIASSFFNFIFNFIQIRNRAPDSCAGCSALSSSSWTRRDARSANAATLAEASNAPALRRANWKRCPAPKSRARPCPLVSRRNIIFFFFFLVRNRYYFKTDVSITSCLMTRKYVGKQARSVENLCPAGVPLTMPTGDRPFLCGLQVGQPQCPQLFDCVVQPGIYSIAPTPVGYTLLPGIFPARPVSLTLF